MTEKWTSVSTPYLLPRAAGESDAWTAEAPGRTSQRLTEVTMAQPPVEVAEALRLAAGDRAVVRRRLILLDGQPVELADSYYPPRIADATPLAEPTKIPGGATTLLARLGYHVHRAVEDIEQRPAEPHETEALLLEPGASVLTLTRTSYSANGAPFEASLMVMKAPRRLRYELEIQ
ncbi:GntR family transcriptional regulator [Streptomyces klenkii]|uniref:GntR family transcriptional regulator n=1 Tax=Streptomyces klenkii TaxID=1420899 RepID=UPI001F541356|nr:UTRA domain-containing protein [Streptomyces klenkii]